MEERDNILHFVEEVGPRLYQKKHNIYSGKDEESYVETNKLRNEHRIIGLFFVASWSDPC